MCNESKCLRHNESRPRRGCTKAGTEKDEAETEDT